MSTSQLTSSRIAYVYHNGGYNIQSWSSIYIGRQSDSANNRGYNSGLFEMKLYNMPNKKKIANITSISIKVTTNENSEGYNGCTVRFDYVGTDPELDQSLWRIGSSSETIYLAENKTTTFKTTNKTTCQNFKKLILNASSGQNFYFRIQRTSGQGVYSKTQVTIIITFDESNIHYYYNGEWKQCIPYYYHEGQWKQCLGKYYHNGVWKQT